MIEDIRKTALAHAMELSRSRINPEASEIVEDASVFENYLTGAVSFSINQLPSCIEDFNNFTGRSFCAPGLNPGKRFPERNCKTTCNGENKTLAGCCICGHKNNSSPKDGESVGEVTTPSRTETVAPDTQPVMQSCTHTRTDGEAL